MTNKKSLGLDLDPTILSSCLYPDNTPFLPPYDLYFLWKRNYM